MILSVLAAAASAQEALSLDEALRLALDASESVELSHAQIERARAARSSALANHLPSLGASLTYDHTFVNEFDARLDDAVEDAAAGARATGPAALTTPPTTTPTTPTGTPPTGQVPATPDFGSLFANNDTWRLALQLSQPVFGGLSAIAQDRMAVAQTDAADAALVSARASAALAVAQAYFDAALADRLVEIAEATLAQAETTLGNARLGNEVGRTAEFDLLRAQVEAENQRVAVIRQSRARDGAHTRLLQLLDLPADTTLALTTPLDDAAPAGQAAVDATGGVDGATAAIEQSEALVRMSEAGVVLARASYFPIVAATVSGGFASYPQSFLPDEWFPSLSAGFSVSVPLFGGGRARGLMISARASEAESRTLLDQTTELADAAVRDAKLELAAAEAQWASTSGTVDQAQKAYDIADVRFREGVSTQSELADARLLLQQATANRALAARDLQVARIRSALLPALPVQTFP